jgi:hypothetical protein
LIVLVPIELAVVALGARRFEVPPEAVIESKFRSHFVGVLKIGSMIRL